MASLIAFLVAAVFFFFLAIGEEIGDLNLLGWGLFAFVLGHLLSGFGPGLGRFDRD